jgi:hypothetical protein
MPELGSDSEAPITQNPLQLALLDVSHAMRLIPHLIVTSVAIEALLACLFILFPVGPCSAPVIGIGIVYLRYPALMFAGHVLGITAYGRQLVLVPLLMVPVWVALLFVLRFLFRWIAGRTDLGGNAT